MSDALTARQTKLLKCLVDEYILTAEPVGSEALDKKYNLEVSPATIRNEMVDLTRKGYLRQPHTSAGRVPTPKAMKFYIDQLMEERQMSVSEEVKAKEEISRVKDDINRLMDEATRTLAETTKSLAVGTIDDLGTWQAGFSNVFQQPEFVENLRISMNLFSLLDETRRLHELFFERMTGMSPIEVIFGEDLGWSDLGFISVAGTRFRLYERECALGVFGSERMEFPRVIPVLRYFRNLMQDIGGYSGNY
jgi:heat-inducible transcriptional repressor